MCDRADTRSAPETATTADPQRPRTERELPERRWKAPSTARAGPVRRGFDLPLAMIGIVGGGISGLAVAQGLASKGVAHVVFESSPDVGGVMRTVTVDAVPLDVGPQRTRLTQEVADLVDAAGLGDQILRAEEDLPLWIYRAGKLRRVPFSLSEALTTDLLGTTGKMRALLEPFTAPLKSEETVARFFTRKFGQEAYRNLIGPLYGGLYASDPARMYARHGLRITLDHFGVGRSLLVAMLRRGAEARRAVDTITFREGLQSLPRALAALEGVNVRTGVAVRGLERLADGGWRLAVERSDSAGAPQAEFRRAAGVHVDRVVLSCPSREAAALLEEAAPSAARRMARLNTNRLAVVHLRSNFQAEGFGYQVAFGETLETRGCTWNASIFGRPGIYTCYLGGMKHPELVDWSDPRIGETARREFQTVTGSEARVLNVSRTYVPAWDRSWDALENLELPQGIHLCSNWSARPGIPGRARQAAELVRALCGSGP